MIIGEDLPQLTISWEEAGYSAEDDMATYDLAEPEMTVHANASERVESIDCFECMYYRGKNLIGMLYEELKTLMDGAAPDSIDRISTALHNDEQDVYTFDALGIMVWAHGGRVTNILCYKPEEYSV